MMQQTWVSDCGTVTLYCADCLDVLPTLGKVDAVVTDPPYGIGEARGKNKSRGNLAHARDYGVSDWDDYPVDQVTIETLLSRAPWKIIFGGNYYYLPPSSCRLVWDKKNGSNDFADCELAWTNLKKAVRLLRYMWNGMLKEFPEDRFHPTQKPIAVMEWCISHLPDGTSTILDPFMGSGTTGVAAVKLGRRFIGIEIDPKYFAIAKERIQTALEVREMDMFKDQKLA